jgi:alpha-tubulin suppressor-like RCC1 family protein
MTETATGSRMRLDTFPLVRFRGARGFPWGRAFALLSAVVGCGLTSTEAPEPAPGSGEGATFDGWAGTGNGGSVASYGGLAGEFSAGPRSEAHAGGAPSLAGAGATPAAGAGGTGGESFAGLAGGFGGDSDGASGAAGEGGSGGVAPLHVMSLSLGFHHTCSLLSDGSVRCWGHGDYGQLGSGNETHIGDDELPSSVGGIDIGAKVIQLSVGGYHSCALLEGGTVRCWGASLSGQLGYASTAEVGDDETPASAGDVYVGGTVTSIAAGPYHTCAVLEGGKARCWGYGDVGELGYGNPETVGDDETPASVGDVDVGGPVKSLALGMFHTCALLETGKVRCWGQGVSGQLGYGNKNNVGDNEAPASAGDVDVGGTVTAIAAGYWHTCALLEGGAVRCWGEAMYGELGYGNGTAIGDNEKPASAGDVPVGAAVVRLDANGLHSCAVLEGQNARCWGYGWAGELGYANVNHVGVANTPAEVGDIEMGGAVERMALGGYHTCALLQGGGVRCFGSANFGQLGYGSTNDIGDDETPASAGEVSIF